MLVSTNIHITDTEICPADMAIAFTHGDDFEQSQFLEILGRESHRMRWAMQCRYIKEWFNINQHIKIDKTIQALELLLEHLKEKPCLKD